ncbi:MAG TPA: hypothetical protein VNM40_01110 [Candidatus Paceibacterota bacterium]|nr:hypothetical protein [Candidatus Paceibacterota bacterium]
MQRHLPTAIRLLEFARGDWIGKGLKPATRHAIFRIVMGVYIEYLKGNQVSKKSVRHIMRANHPTTPTKYVNLAIDYGWLKVVSGSDRRQRLIEPTDQLILVIKDFVSGISGAH